MGKTKVIIIGGGASGIMAAITASRLGAKVTILERKDRIGRKILATGNGRCNITNKNISNNCYHNKKEDQAFLEKTINAFNVNETLSFFNELGIEIAEKEAGKLYPRSDQANSVLSVLLLELERLKVEIICEEEVERIEINKNIRVYTRNNKYYCNKLIIAAGGKSCPDLGSNGSGFQLAKSLGHSINQTFPSLVQLKTDYPFLKHLKGTKVIGNVKLLDNSNVIITEDKGEILFTDYGISGPPVLQISRQASYNFINNIDTYCSIDLVPEYTTPQLDELLTKRFSLMPSKEAKDSLIGFVNNRLIIPILKTSEIELGKKAGDITRLERNRISNSLKNISMKVIGTNDYNNSQVTGGGIKLNELNINTLASNKVKDVYFCGEILDVDGICGGYNLQWAWSSGYVAGKNAALN